MSRHSNFHAKVGRRGAAMYRSVSLALALLTFVVLLAGAPARAAAFAPFAGDVLQSADAVRTDRLAEGRLNAYDRRDAFTRKAFAVRSPERAASRSFFGARLVLAPRRVTEASNPGRLAAADRTVLVQVSWSEAVAPSTDANPFALVGNRSGLVSATQSEVRGGEVWLTAGGGLEVADNGGAGRNAAP